MASRATNVTDLITGLTSVCLGAAPGFGVLPFGLDIKSNVFKAADQKLSVVALEANQAPGVMHTLTLDQKFRITLSRSYAVTQVGDSDQQAQTAALQNLAIDVFTALIVAKAGRPDIVLNVFGLAVSTPTYIEKKTVTINLSFHVLYRNTY